MTPTADSPTWEVSPHNQLQENFKTLSMFS